MSVPTLFHLASKTLAACNHYTDLSRNIMPNEVTEQLVLHFTEKKLLTFVESNGSIKKIRDNFSTNGFQRFYLHFHNVKNLIINVNTQSKFDEYLVDLKNICCFLKRMLNILHIVIFVSNLWDLKEILENLILLIISLSQNLVIEQYLK